MDIDEIKEGQSSSDGHKKYNIEKQLEMHADPQLLKKSAGEESCCIFRVPQSLSEVNPQAYEPKVVSIGPYHYKKRQLKMIQEHKHRFLKIFLTKTAQNGVDKSVMSQAVQDLEIDIRNSYSEALVGEEYSDLLTTMILDGCFIVTLFLIVSRKITLDDETDPIFTIPWIIPSIRSDLLLLENQVPLSLLETLFKKSKLGGPSNFNQMVFTFFNYSMFKKDSYWLKHKDVKAKHLLDLIRQTFIYDTDANDKVPADVTHPKKKEDISQSILSAKKLRLQGIKFRLSDNDSLLAITLEKNKLKIPLLRLDGFTSSFLLNSVAFEQFYTKSSNHITSYVVFMGCLLDGENDAIFLTNEKRIIQNYFGNEFEVSQFFKKINKDIAFDVSKSYLKKVFQGVNDYTSQNFTGMWAEFRHTHFESPWTCLSSFAVLLVIFLTIGSFIVAVLSYLKEKKRI